MHPIFSCIAEKFKTVKGSNGSVWLQKYFIPIPFEVEKRFVFVKCSKGEDSGLTVLHIRVRRVMDGWSNKLRDDEEAIISTKW